MLNVTVFRVFGVLIREKHVICIFIELPTFLMLSYMQSIIFIFFSQTPFPFCLIRLGIVPFFPQILLREIVMRKEREKRNTTVMNGSVLGRCGHIEFLEKKKVNIRRLDTRRLRILFLDVKS